MHLVEDVAQVRLDCLPAEEQLRSDLSVGLAVDDEACDLEFAFGQRLDAGRVGLARLGAPVDVVSEFPQLAFSLVAVAQGAAGVERGSGTLKFRYATVGLPALGERAARECA